MSEQIPNGDEFYKHRIERNRKHCAIPSEIIDAGHEDFLIKNCIEEYLVGNVSYMGFLEKLAIIQYKRNKQLQDSLIRIHGLRTNIDAVFIPAGGAELIP